VYNFTDPCYFKRATLQPRDYLGEHLLNTSSFSEPSFVDAAALLAPPHDYKRSGKPDAYFKWSVTQDGFIKRAEGAIFGPLDAADSAKAGLNVFDPRTLLLPAGKGKGGWPAGAVQPGRNRFSDYKAALHGAYGRSVHVAAWDRATQQGFSVSALATGRGLGSIVPNPAEHNLTWVLGRIAEVRKPPSWPRSWANFSLFTAVFPQECMGQPASFGPT
jgi:hypothetical protein